MLQMVWVVAFLATVLLDVDLGLMVAVGFGILTIVARSQRYVFYLTEVFSAFRPRDKALFMPGKRSMLRICEHEVSLNNASNKTRWMCKLI